MPGRKCCFSGAQKCAILRLVPRTLDDITDFPASPYDRETPEADLWFVPGPPEDAAWDMPGPRADRIALPTARDWERAEAGQGRALAAAAAALARLDERLALSPRHEGLLRRLALEEAAGLSWAEGAGIAADRLALYDVLRLTTAADAHRDFALAHWAFRRLHGGAGPEAGLGPFLGRRNTAEDGLGELGQRPTGEVFSALADDWGRALRADLHPIARAAMAFHLWQALGLSGPEGVVEAAVAAARIGAPGLKALTFLPLAVGGRGLWQRGGNPAARLSAFLAAVEAGAKHGAIELDRIAGWQARAEAATAGLSGRAPALLIGALVALPALTAEMAAEVTGLSRAAVLRNLALFEARGVVREITGQERFRVWTARL
jgi:hypothetical protein